MRTLFLKLMGRYYQVTGHFPGFVANMQLRDVPIRSKRTYTDWSIAIGMWELEYGFYTPVEGAWLPRQLAKIRATKGREE